ncbi:MAG TPA: hypothetical protein VK249_07885 [Anaerolineales bacterium]|nr:hypothetical protein [Anaerolineales bacterium]
MSTIASTSPATRNPLLRLSVIGGLILGMLHLIIQSWFVYSFLEKNPFISVLQYVASGAMGNAAFAGGPATALLGLILDFLMTTIMAGVFILSIDRIPLLRSHVIPGSLLYGFGVFIVMNFIVLPLSAAPPLPAPSTWLFIEMILEHILLIGLPLGLLMRQYANTNQ